MQGSDEIKGEQGNDLLNGSDGNDVSGWGAFDTLDGGTFVSFTLFAESRWNVRLFNDFYIKDLARISSIYSMLAWSD